MIEVAKLQKYFAVSDNSAKEITSSLNMMYNMVAYPRSRYGATTLNAKAFIQFLYPGMQYDQDIQLLSWRETKTALEQLHPIFNYRLTLKNMGYSNIRSALDRKKGSPYRPAYKLVEDNFRQSEIHDLLCSISWKDWENTFTNIFTDYYATTPIHTWVKETFEIIIKLWIAAHIECTDTNQLKFGFSLIADGNVPIAIFDPPNNSNIKPHTLVLVSSC